MTTIEKCKLAIEKGYRYDENTGEIFGIKGGVVKGKNKNGSVRITITHNSKSYSLSGVKFAWYFKHNELPIWDKIKHINGDNSDNRIVNLRLVRLQKPRYGNGWRWDKQSKKYMAHIRVNGRLIDLGLFDTKEETFAVYKNAQRIYNKK